LKYLVYLLDHLLGKQSLKRSLGINLPLAILFPIILGEFGLLWDGTLLVITLFLFWGWGIFGVIFKCIRKFVNFDREEISMFYRIISFLLFLALIWLAGYVVLDAYRP
jgi:hypothetical protein